MGFMDELKKLTHPYSEPEEDDYDDYDDEPLTTIPLPRLSLPAAAIAAAPRPRRIRRRPAAATRS